jgi:hypothetical protein
MCGQQCSRHCERSEAIQPFSAKVLDCFVASFLAMTAEMALLNFFHQGMQQEQDFRLAHWAVACER